MPHIVISGPVSTEDIWIAFQPTEFAEGENRFKAEEALLNHTKDTLLIRSLVVERGFVKNFLVRISRKDEKSITIGLEKLTRPEVTDAVKRLLGLYAWRILQAEPEAVVESTNIKEFLADYTP